jgi:hypothetical protein
MSIHEIRFRMEWDIYKKYAKIWEKIRMGFDEVLLDEVRSKVENWKTIKVMKKY